MVESKILIQSNKVLNFKSLHFFFKYNHKKYIKFKKYEQLRDIKFIRKYFYDVLN